MNITILSGGSGNDALMKGIFEYYPNANIKVIVNAYDDGKSTGVCRTITNTLGASDIRKNHIRLYKLKNRILDKRIIEFYCNRYDLPKGEEKDFVAQKLTQWGLSNLITWSNLFFEKINKDEYYVFNDFSIANICYSIMYKQIGYESTNNFFCKLLNIEDFVILNSHSNVRIKALTSNGILKDEASIVDYNNVENPISRIIYDSEDSGFLNKRAIDILQETDLLIISCGTFWSSIYPTLEYGDLYMHINNISCKKIWIMNNEEDKDAVGIDSNKFISVLSILGLNLSDFYIIQNELACDSLKKSNDDFKIVRRNLGNDNGKHSPTLLAKCIFDIYYGFPSEYDKIFIDFDDTIWSRDAQKDDKLLCVSIDNVRLCNKKNIVVVSGNNYDAISGKIFMSLGTKDEHMLFSLWCDANSIQYKNDEVFDYVEDLIIKDSFDKISNYIEDNFNIKSMINNTHYPTCIKIKPLDSMTRDILYESLNRYIFNDMCIKGLMAKKTGRTTIDIVKDNNNKGVLFDKIKKEGEKILYIGDECHNGNDIEISKKSDSFINVTSIDETNLILRLL